MSEKVIAVALDINKIPYVNNPEIIFTLGKQKIWYTTDTLSVEIPKFVQFSDLLLNKFIARFLKKSDKRNIFTFKYFTNRVATALKNCDYDELVFENDSLKRRILSKLNNKHRYAAKRALPAEG